MLSLLYGPALTSVHDYRKTIALAMWTWSIEVLDGHIHWNPIQRWKGELGNMLKWPLPNLVLWFSNHLDDLMIGEENSNITFVPIIFTQSDTVLKARKMKWTYIKHSQWTLCRCPILYQAKQLFPLVRLSQVFHWLLGRSTCQYLETSDPPEGFSVFNSLSSLKSWGWLAHK